MKKILLVFGLVIVSLIGNAQLVNETVKVTAYIILQGDTIRLDSPIDGEVLKRTGGVWTNGTGAAGSAAVDSLIWNFTTGYLGWYIGGSISDSLDMDGRYVEISDTLTSGKYYSQYQIDNLVANTEKHTYRITLPIAGDLNTSVTNATDVPSGWTLAAVGGNLQVTHNLGSYSSAVRVKYNTSGSSYRHLKDFENGFTGLIDTDNNILVIESISTYYTAAALQIMITLE